MDDLHNQRAKYHAMQDGTAASRPSAIKSCRP